MVDAAGGKAKYSMERANDGQSADEQRRLGSVLFRSCAYLILGRPQRRRREFAQVDVRSKLSEATKPSRSAGRTA